MSLTRRVPGRVRSVYDGDTLRADLRLGWHVVLENEPLRLFGIDTPELRGADKIAGRAARNWVRAWLIEYCDRTNDMPEIVVESVQWDGTRGKYGRALARVWDTPQARCLNDDLIRAGHAVPLN